MKEIVVISGKGGTGKTSLTAAFAFLEGNNAVVADCDVDSANMHLLTGSMPELVDDFYSGYEARIDQDQCSHCSLCVQACQFDAISDDHVVDEIACEGCGYCSHVCPEDAITMLDSFTGKLSVSKTRFNNSLVHADLAINGENSGKLVTAVKNTARELAQEQSCQILLVDGPPGIGCPVLASLSGASYVIIVTEASAAGYSDLDRVYKLIRRFKSPCGVMLNKADLDRKQRDKIIMLCRKNEIPVFGEIPYDRSFNEAMKQGITILEHEGNAVSGIIQDSWIKIRNHVKE